MMHINIMHIYSVYEGLHQPSHRYPRFLSGSAALYSLYFDELFAENDSGVRVNNNAVSTHHSFPCYQRSTYEEADWPGVRVPAVVLIFAPDDNE